VDIPRFRSSTLFSLPFGDHPRPTQALLNTVYLWGLHLSQPETLINQERTMLWRAVQHCTTDLLGEYPLKILHTIQVHVLLAYYFFRTGRFLEAKYHSDGAVSLALGAGLHKIRSLLPSPPPILRVVANNAASLQEPQDDIEQGARIGVCGHRGIHQNPCWGKRTRRQQALVLAPTSLPYHLILGTEHPTP
jgi:hypothetical protein